MSGVVFTRPGDRVRIVSGLESCIREIRALEAPHPNDIHWTRIAIIAKLLVCSAQELQCGVALQNAVARLAAFIDENHDLLVMELTA